jgi:ATP-dependent Clp endopeptidase proteolytic subunit ClpP
MTTPAWYAISTPRNSEAEDSGVEVSIYDEIGFGGVAAKDFVADLRKLKGQHIHLRINSVGGSVIEGAAIYNALRRHKGGLTVHVDGLAASMASVIAMAGDDVLMADNAMMMVHNPWSMAMGDADDLRKEADVLDKLKATLVNAYVRKSGRERAEIENLMDEETWMDAVQAVDFGFADDIEEGIEAAASITPEAARARFDNFSNSMARKSTKTIKAEEAAPAEVIAEPVVEQPVTDAAVDISTENISTELKAQIEDLQAKLTASEAAKAESDAAAAQASEDIIKEVEALKAEVERLTSEVASKDEEISNLLASSKSAGEQAAAIVASVGLEPVAVVASEPELTAAQKFAALEGAEATEFYRAHKREIFSTYVL